MRNGRYARSSAVPLALLVLTGCTTAGGGTSGNQVQNTILDTNRMVRDIDRNVSSTMSTLTTTAAELTSRIDAQEQELRRLTSTSEENQRKLETLQRSLDDLTVTLYRHFNLTPPPRVVMPSGPGGLNTPRESGSGEISFSPPPTAPTFDSALPPVSVLPPLEEPKTGVTPDEHYRDAQELFKADNYPDALAAFREHLRLFPNSMHIDKAQYWVAHSYFRMGEFEQSIPEYEKIWTLYPNSDKVPTAMHNAAVSYSRMGQNERAIEMFQRLIREHPDSAASENARTLLRQLQGLN